VDATAAARQIIESLVQLFFSAELQGRFHGAADTLGLSPPMFRALLDLTPDEGLPMRDLAERWGCDASFVTVTCDALQARGLIERRVAPHDRRIRMVELTDEGADAKRWAIGEVYGPSAGFSALSDDEQATLATLLARLAEAQARHDEELLAQPGPRAMARRMQAQRTREHHRSHAATADVDDPGSWKAHFEAHRRELHHLKEELARVRAEITSQARRPVDEAKAAKSKAKARARRPVDEAKAAKSKAKARVRRPVDEAKAAKSRAKAQAKAGLDGARHEVAAHLKGERGGR
jgi:DNA-binding MarR family transcriptional regulator